MLAEGLGLSGIVAILFCGIVSAWVFHLPLCQVLVYCCIFKRKKYKFFTFWLLVYSSHMFLSLPVSTHQKIYIHDFLLPYLRWICSDKCTWSVALFFTISPAVNEALHISKSFRQCTGIYGRFFPADIFTGGDLCVCISHLYEVDCLYVHRSSSYYRTKCFLLLLLCLTKFTHDGCRGLGFRVYSWWVWK
jgi:hypothetical protein